MKIFTKLPVLLGVVLLAAGPAQADRPGTLQSRMREDGFTAAQGMIVSSAADAMTNMARKLSQGKGELAGMIQQAMALEGQIAALNRQIDGSLDQKGPEVSGRRAELQKQAQALSTQLTELEVKIAERFPAYAELTQPKPLSSAEVQTILAPDEAMLLIIPGKNGTYLFAVSKEKFDWAKSSLTEKDVAGAVEALRASLVDTAGKPFDRGLAFRLYSEFITPVENILAGKRVLYTLTTGRLQELPLQALVSSKPAGDDADPSAVRATRWLIDDFALVTLPAVSSLETLRCYAVRKPQSGCGGNAQERPATADTGVAFAGVGDPALDPYDGFEYKGPTAGQYSDGPYASPPALMGLRSIPSSGDELNALARHFHALPSLLMLGKDATETRVKTSSEVSRARVLVFSTHALTASQVQSIGQPGLVLTPPPMPSDADDGFLTAGEVSQLHLSADFVVLSACNTAAPDGVPNSEWMSGLARGFFYAGARSLLVSHWPVVGVSTPVLMDRVFVQAEQMPQNGRAVALQNAIQAMKKTNEWWHPRFWAAFVLVGDPHI